MDKTTMIFREMKFALAAVALLVALGCARYGSVVEQMQQNEDAAIAAQGAANE